jgi:hypothetical protein
LRRGLGPFGVIDYGAMYRRAGELFKELKSEMRPREIQTCDDRDGAVYLSAGGASSWAWLWTI